MVQRVTTVAFEGIEARAVDVQVQVAPGLPHFAILCRIKSMLCCPNVQSSRLLLHSHVYRYAT
jgi:hypothetical protein